MSIINTFLKGQKNTLNESINYLVLRDIIQRRFKFNTTIGNTFDCFQHLKCKFSGYTILAN